MKIYTKTGDKGTTALANGARVSKTNPRIEAYGTADELNAFVGLLQAKLQTISQSDAIEPDAQAQASIWAERLVCLQSKLFNLGAFLSSAQGEWITQSDVEELENWIDDIQESLEPLHAFILPAGAEEIALTHVCRTITRRLERQIIALNEQSNQMTNAQQWVNRMSDFFFVLSRKICKLLKKSTFLWKK